MRLSWTVTIALLVEQAAVCVGSALTRRIAFKRETSLAREATFIRDTSLTKRDDASWSLSKRIPQTSTNITLSQPDIEKNISTSQACLTSMQSMTSVSNEAGFAACYNILDWHPNEGGQFQADLRLFQYSSATGNFQNISMNDITIFLTYPNSTRFSILTTTKQLQSRQDSSPSAIKQFSLTGGFQMQLDSKKLNDTQLMSLLIPEIRLQSSMDGNMIDTTLSTNDITYFVTGQFSNQVSAESIQEAANPVMALAAIESSRGFVLPGTTFGIFPVGLIVTGSWSVLFLVAFGLGTVGRMRHRDIYRKRMAATAQWRK